MKKFANQFIVNPNPVKRLIVSRELFDIFEFGIEELPSYTDRIGLIFAGLTLLLELRDLWVGLYWDYEPPQMEPWGPLKNHTVKVYLCLVPCFPLRLTLVFSAHNPWPNE